MGICSAMVFAGIFIASFCGLARTWVPIPVEAAFILFMFGLIVAFVGMMILYTRINKMGLNWLIQPGNPRVVNWFYIYKDGEVFITPSFRKGEGILHAPHLDATIPDVRTYSLGDHKVRFVAEATGHACDTDMIQYVQLLKSKWGWTNLRQARAGILKLIKGKEFIPETTTKRLGIEPGYIKRQQPRVR